MFIQSLVLVSSLLATPNIHAGWIEAVKPCFALQLALVCVLAFFVPRIFPPHRRFLGRLLGIVLWGIPFTLQDFGSLLGFFLLVGVCQPLGTALLMWNRPRLTFSFSWVLGLLGGTLIWGIFIPTTTFFPTLGVAGVGVLLLLGDAVWCDVWGESQCSGVRWSWSWEDVLLFPSVAIGFGLLLGDELQAGGLDIILCIAGGILACFVSLTPGVGLSGGIVLAGTRHLLVREGGEGDEWDEWGEWGDGRREGWMAAWGYCATSLGLTLDTPVHPLVRVCGGAGFGVGFGLGLGLDPLTLSVVAGCVLGLCLYWVLLTKVMGSWFSGPSLEERCDAHIADIKSRILKRKVMVRRAEATAEQLMVEYNEAQHEIQQHILLNRSTLLLGFAQEMLEEVAKLEYLKLEFDRLKLVADEIGAMGKESELLSDLERAGRQAEGSVQRNEILRDMIPKNLRSEVPEGDPGLALKLRWNAMQQGSEEKDDVVSIHT